MPTTINMVGQVGQVKLGNLEYGTIFTCAPNNPESTYIKVNKRKLGSGILMQFSEGTSVACNLKTGGLREINGSALVRVLVAEINVRPMEKEERFEYVRDWGDH